MTPCIHKGCKFRTNQFGRMTHHVNNQHGGKTDDAQAGKREFRGHLATARKRKER